MGFHFNRSPFGMLAIAPQLFFCLGTPRRFSLTVALEGCAMVTDVETAELRSFVAWAKGANPWFLGVVSCFSLGFSFKGTL